MPLLYKSRIVIAVIYLFLISVLFCLPGSSFPKDDWMSRIYFDKWIHIGFFVVLAWLWCWALELTQRKLFFLLLLSAAVYGLLVEAVQHFFIANRSFDVGDLLADMTGSIAGLWLWQKTNRYI